MTLRTSGLWRRELLRLSPLALLSAFAVPGARERALRAGSLGTDAALGLLPRGGLAPEFAMGDLTAFVDFPVNSYLTDDPGVDAGEWKLTVEGAVERPGEYSLDELRRLRKRTQITRHVCIEGWAAIGSFGGIVMGDFLRFVGARAGARFVEVECADDYYESMEMACAMHPQTLLCTEMYGGPLTVAHGAPLRLQMPTKLGYKQAKYVTTLRVSEVLGARRGYWVDQGYPWFGGI